ncbi:MAG: hypothetical protein WCR04_11330 [Fibrobacteraceae bacterium]
MAKFSVVPHSNAQTLKLKGKRELSKAASTAYNTIIFHMIAHQAFSQKLEYKVPTAQLSKSRFHYSPN